MQIDQTFYAEKIVDNFLFEKRKDCWSSIEEHL